MASVASIGFRALRALGRAANDAIRLKGRDAILGELERPGRRHPYTRSVDVRGWAVSTKGDALKVQVSVNGRVVAELGLSEERPEIASQYPDLPPRARSCGFDAVVSLESVKAPRLSLLSVSAVSRAEPSSRRILGLSLLQRRGAGARQVPRHAYQETWDAVALSLHEARNAVAGSVDAADLDRSGESTALDIVNETQLLPTDRVLEIGCGVGRVGVKLAPRCREWVGGDVSLNMLEHARKALADVPNARFVHLNGSDLTGVGDDSFDVVYCTTVFMHLDEWDRFRYVRDAYRTLKPGGRIYFDNFSLLSTDGWRLFEQLAKMDPAARPPNISKSSTPEELREYAVKAGFTNTRVRDGAMFVTVVGTKPAKA